MQGTLVSVVIPTANRPSDVVLAVESVLAQDYPLIEIVVVDDCSTPPLVLPAWNLPGRSVKLVRNERSMGGGFSRMEGVHQSRGELIAFLDDDDLYYPNKIRDLSRILENRPDLDAVFGLVEVEDRGKTYFVVPSVEFGTRLTSVSAACSLQTNGSLIRRGVFSEVRFDSSLKKYQDTQFHVELVKKKNVALFKLGVALWRKNYSPTQISSVAGKVSARTSLQRFDALMKYFDKGSFLSAEEFDFFLKKRLRQCLEHGLYAESLDRAIPRRMWLPFEFLKAFLFFRAPYLRRFYSSFMSKNRIASRLN